MQRGFIAEDGKVFTSEEECKKYEEGILKKKKAVEEARANRLAKDKELDDIINQIDTLSHNLVDTLWKHFEAFRDEEKVLETLAKYRSVTHIGLRIMEL